HGPLASRRGSSTRRCDLLDGDAMGAGNESDGAAILEHVDSIFRAYERRDLDALRATHSPDWTGFQLPSRRIERGLEAYMRNAELSLATWRGTGHELLETDLQLFGR